MTSAFVTWCLSCRDEDGLWSRLSFRCQHGRKCVSARRFWLHRQRNDRLVNVFVTEVSFRPGSGETRKKKKKKRSARPREGGDPSLPRSRNLWCQLKAFSYLVDPASFGTLNLELKPCILLTAYPATGRAISVHGSVDRWDERAVLHFKVITTETLWLIPFPTPRAFVRVETPPVRTLGSAGRPRGGRAPSGVGSFAGGEHEVTKSVEPLPAGSPYHCLIT